MKSFYIHVCLVLATMCIHIPSIYSQKMLHIVKRDVGPKFQTFCEKTGGKRVVKNDFACTAGPAGKPTRPVCAMPKNKNVRGLVKCTEKGTLKINFADCGKPKIVFCEPPEKTEVSCKEGPTGTAVKNPPHVTCVTNGKPDKHEPQCVANKPNSFNKFSGKLQCQKGAILTFIGGDSKGKNPCPGNAAALFCTPPKKTAK
ncbi:hypothetical protein DFH28DRAFT_160815 [Melampsora americana]|nr:hypothetical protein DFH28DRAFT_160815 [Melampsora americana]